MLSRNRKFLWLSWENVGIILNPIENINALHRTLISTSSYTSHGNFKTCLDAFIRPSNSTACHHIAALQWHYWRCCFLQFRLHWALILFFFSFMNISPAKSIRKFLTKNSYLLIRFLGLIPKLFPTLRKMYTSLYPFIMYVGRFNESMELDTIREYYTLLSFTRYFELQNKIFTLN